MRSVTSGAWAWPVERRAGLAMAAAAPVMAARRESVMRGVLKCVMRVLPDRGCVGLSWAVLPAS